jgi:hypothetical protein
MLVAKGGAEGAYIRNNTFSGGLGWAVAVGNAEQFVVEENVRPFLHPLQIQSSALPFVVSNAEPSSFFRYRTFQNIHSNTSFIGHRSVNCTNGVEKQGNITINVPYLVQDNTTSSVRLQDDFTSGNVIFLPCLSAPSSDAHAYATFSSRPPPPSLFPSSRFEL